MPDSSTFPLEFRRRKTGRPVYPCHRRITTIAGPLQPVNWNCHKSFRVDRLNTSETMVPAREGNGLPVRIASRTLHSSSTNREILQKFGLNLAIRREPGCRRMKRSLKMTHRSAESAKRCCSLNRYFDRPPSRSPSAVVRLPGISGSPSALTPGPAFSRTGPSTQLLSGLWTSTVHDRRSHSHVDLSAVAAADQTTCRK